MENEFSKSPGRHTFQMESYVKRCTENGEEPSQDYIDLMGEMANTHENRFSDPKSRDNSMEYDLLTTDWILEKVRNSEAYAQNLYAAICNNEFVKVKFPDTPDGVVDALKSDVKPWGCSWRYAGGIVADMSQEGDYIDWYCSGIRDTGEPSEEEWASWTKEQQTNYTNIYSKYVGESVVTEEISKDLLKLGWKVLIQDE